MGKHQQLEDLIKKQFETNEHRSFRALRMINWQKNEIDRLRLLNKGMEDQYKELGIAVEDRLCAIDESISVLQQLFEESPPTSKHQLEIVQALPCVQPKPDYVIENFLKEIKKDLNIIKLSIAHDHRKIKLLAKRSGTIGKELAIWRNRIEGTLLNMKANTIGEMGDHESCRIWKTARRFFTTDQAYLFYDCISKTESKCSSA